MAAIKRDGISGLQDDVRELPERKKLEVRLKEF